MEKTVQPEQHSIVLMLTRTSDNSPYAQTHYCNTWTFPTTRVSALDLDENAECIQSTLLQQLQWVEMQFSQMCKATNHLMTNIFSNTLHHKELHF